MTDDKIRQVIQIYREYFAAHGIKPEFFGFEARAAAIEPVLEHCSQMLDQIERFLAEGRRDKAFRWLGFLQGCLFAAGCYSIGELADHNRS